MFGNPYPELSPCELALESNTELLKLGSWYPQQQSRGRRGPASPITSDREKPLKARAGLVIEDPNCILIIDLWEVGLKIHVLCFVRLETRDPLPHPLCVVVEARRAFPLVGICRLAL